MRADKRVQGYKLSLLEYHCMKVLDLVPYMDAASIGYELRGQKIQDIKEELTYNTIYFTLERLLSLGFVLYNQKYGISQWRLTEDGKQLLNIQS